MKVKKDIIQLMIQKIYKLFLKYKELSCSEKNVIFGGRLGDYKYYDMHMVIGSALSKSKKILEE